MPDSTRLDREGSPYKGRIAWNKGGGATDDMTLDYYKHLFEEGGIFEDFGGLQAVHPAGKPPYAKWRRAAAPASGRERG